MTLHLGPRGRDLRLDFRDGRKISVVAAGELLSTCCSAARAAASLPVSSSTSVCARSRSKRLPAPVATSSVFCFTRVRASASEALTEPTSLVA